MLPDCRLSLSEPYSMCNG